MPNRCPDAPSGQAADYWAATLRAQGVRYAFGQGGLEAVEMLEALRAAGVEFVWFHHETPAAFAAATLGELTGTPGICVTTRGPGATNMLTGVANALLDRQPLLAFSGDTDPRLKATLPHQELPLVAIFAPATLRAGTLSADNLSVALPEAIAVALGPRPGPVFLAFPQVEARQEMTTRDASPVLPPSVAAADAPGPAWSTLPGESDAALKGRPGSGESGPLFRAAEVKLPRPPAVDAAQLLEGLRFFHRARRPLLYVGLGAPLCAAWVRELARALGAPVVTTPKGKGTFPEDDPLFVGTFPAYQDRPVRDLLASADLIVAVGLDGVELARPWEVDAPVLSFAAVGADDPALQRQDRPSASVPPRIVAGSDGPPGHVTDVLAVEGDPGVTLDYLLRNAPTSSTRGWPTGEIERARAARAALLRPDWRPDGRDDAGHSLLSPLTVLPTLRALLPREAIVTCDVGSHRQLAAQCWPAYEPRTFLTSNGLSSVGYALPAAIAASLAHPGAPVACLIGDGGLLMYPGELQTLARLGGWVVIVVWADDGSSSTRLEHERRGYPTMGGTFGGEADFAALAHSFGIWSRTIQRVDEVELVLREALGVGGPALVQVPLRYDVYRGMQG